MFLAVASCACQPTEPHLNTQPVVARQTRSTLQLLGFEPTGAR